MSLFAVISAFTRQCGVVTDALRMSAFTVVYKLGLGKVSVVDNEVREPFTPI